MEYYTRFLTSRSNPDEWVVDPEDDHPFLTEGKKSGRFFQFPSDVVDIRHGSLGSQTTPIDEHLDDVLGVRL